MTKTKNTPVFFIHRILPLLSIFALVNTANAATTTYKVTNPIATSDFAKIVANFLKWFLSVAGAIAMIMLIIAGIMYMGSAGDPQKAASAKKMVMITLGGLILSLLSYSILVIIDNIFTK